MADMADAPGGRSLAFTARSLQLSTKLDETPLRSDRGRRGFDRQGVNIGLQKVIDGGVDQAMAGHGGYAAERFGHDGHAKVPVTLRGSGVARMQMTLVLDDQSQGGKMALETPAKPVLAGAHPGGSVWADLALPLSQKIWGSMNRNIATGMPITLKWTQALSVKFRAM